MSITYIFIWLAVGFICGIIEIFVPIKFRFLCFTISADITAICNIFLDDIIVLSIIFVIVGVTLLCVSIALDVEKRLEKTKSDDKESE